MKTGQRIIINNRSGLSDSAAVARVHRVIEDGLVSNGDTQYCYITHYQDGIGVYADRTKSGTHTFTITNRK